MCTNFYGHVFSIFVYIFWNGIARSYGEYCYYLKRLHSVNLGSCPVLAEVLVLGLRQFWVYQGLIGSVWGPCGGGMNSRSQNFQVCGLPHSLLFCWPYGLGGFRNQTQVLTCKASIIPVSYSSHSFQKFYVEGVIPGSILSQSLIDLLGKLKQFWRDKVILFYILWYL